MSDTAPAVTSGPPATADPQDPLPESAWFWRRLFVFLFGLILAGFLAWNIWLLGDLGQQTIAMVGRIAAARDAIALNNALAVVSDVIRALQAGNFWLNIVLLVVMALYLIAPSAEQAAKMMATVSAWKSGISTSTTATTSGPGGTATTTTTAGPTAAPASPLSTVITTIQKDWAKYAG